MKQNLSDTHPIQFFHKGDIVIEQYKGKIIIDTPANGEHCLQIVDVLRQTRFIIDLDDSKSCGYRKSFGMNYNEQLTACRKYIDLLTE